jgi:UPF0716 protein FxsA
VAALLVLAFLLVPVAEIYVLIQVGHAIGAWQTVLLLVVESVVGGWIVRREGRRAWRALRTAFATGRFPSRELTDAGLILAGGVLLLTPGFLTDIAGWLLVLPLTRPLARRLLTAYLVRRVRLRVAAAGRGPVVEQVAGEWRSRRNGAAPSGPGRFGPAPGRGRVIDDPGPPPPRRG